MRTLLIALFLLVPATAHAEVWTKSFPAGANPRVRINTEEAKVRVRAHSGSTIDVHVEQLGSVTGLRIGTHKPHVRIEPRDGAIEVEVETRGVSAGITLSTLHYEVDIDVPEDCDVAAMTADGSLEIEGLRGNVDVSSSDGRVTLRDLKGEVVLRAQDGPVVAEGLVGRLAASTKDGSLRVSGRFDALELEANDAPMEISVAPGSKPAETWTLSSRDGGIQLMLPDDLRANLDASVRDGNLDVEMSGSAQISGGEVRSLKMALNGGGPTLRVRASDGSVRIRGGS